MNETKFHTIKNAAELIAVRGWETDGEGFATRAGAGREGWQIADRATLYRACLALEMIAKLLDPHQRAIMERERQEQRRYRDARNASSEVDFAISLAMIGSPKACKWDLKRHLLKQFPNPWVLVFTESKTYRECCEAIIAAKASIEFPRRISRDKKSQAAYRQWILAGRPKRKPKTV